MGDSAMFAGSQIVILGLARQGLALARFFVANGARVTISDVAPAEKLAVELAMLGDLPVRLVLGGHPLDLLEGCDVLCLSGGVPPQIEIVQAAVARGIRLSNDSLLTLQLAKQRRLGPTLAVTGSSGKTTTTTLVARMLAAAGKTVHVGGNIGVPLIDRIDTIRTGDCVVLELSSFQLELFDPALAWGEFDDLGPDVAAILNVTPNHLDRHPNMAAYTAAKFNLLRWMRPGGAVVLNADDVATAAVLDSDESAGKMAALPAAWDLGAVVVGAQKVIRHAHVSRVGFSQRQMLAAGAWLEGDTLIHNGQPICGRCEVKLRGDHNISNLLAAAAISGAVGVTAAAMGEVARTFAGVPHRLEVVVEDGGVTWVNDSIATSPERAVAGLRSFAGERVTLILLAGGKDKNLPWEAFADEVLERVNYLIGFGQAGPMIVDKVQERARFRRRSSPNSAVVHGLDEAIELAARTAMPGTVVLLSPGGTSYDAYKDFEARGEHFRQLVQRVTERV